MKKILLIIILIPLFLLSYKVVQAGPILPAAHGGKCNVGTSAEDCGNYTLNDFVRLAANVSTIILQLIGSVSLLMFVYGGVMMIVSSGAGGIGSDGKSKINQGKKTIMAAIVGLVIVFSSYLIIKFVLASFGIEWKGRIQELKTSQTTTLQIRNT